MKETISEKVERECLSCKSIFYAWKYQKKHRYCSSICFGKSLQKGKYYTCEVCSNKFYVGKAKEHQANRFCSNKCQGLSYRTNSATTTHGLSKSPEHRIWSHVKARCINPKTIGFHLYGGRGIKVCERWINSFENFYNDMGPRPSSKYSIDRIDVNRDYSPENCRWATKEEQLANRRNTRHETVDGVSKPLTVWAKEYGMDYQTALYRIHNLGWDAKKALTIPVNKELKSCKHGHPYPESFYYLKNGRRDCKLCMKIRGERYRERLKQKNHY